MGGEQLELEPMNRPQELQAFHSAQLGAMLWIALDRIFHASYYSIGQR